MPRAALTLALAAVVLHGAASAQESRSADAAGVVVAMDHLETKGVTAWIVTGPTGTSRALVVAVLGAPRRTRISALPMRDVILDPAGRHAFLVVERDGALALERVLVEGTEPPKEAIHDLGLGQPVLHRAGDDVVVLTGDAIVAIEPDGAMRPLFRKETADIVDFACNDVQSMVASRRQGSLSLVGSDGVVLGTLGEGTSPAFVQENDLAWVSREVRGSTSTVFLLDTKATDAPALPFLSLAGEVSRLRGAGQGCLSFRHLTDSGAARDWLLHLATGVSRPMAPRDYGALSPALHPSSRPAATPGVVQRADAVPEPEFETSGFFFTDHEGFEYRTNLEAGGWDETRHAAEAQTHRRLLDAFIANVQWPFLREAAYEAVIASDDEPFRPFSEVPHRGLDLGARLLHTSTGSVAFHVPGTYVYPLVRGGEIWRNRTAIVRQEGSTPPAAARTFTLIQEVELRESGYLLRIHIAYEHAGGHEDPPSEEGFPVDGAQPIGALDAFDLGDPSGGWATSDPALRAAGIAKGCHVHVGIGGVYTSFNGVPAAAALKLRWYREQLIPALKRARGP